MLPSCPWAVFTLNNLIANQRGFFHPPDTKYAVSFQIPLLQLPDTNYLEIASDSTYWRVESHKTGPPLQMPVVRPRILYFFWWNSYKSGVPTMTSPGSTVFWNDSQNSGEHFMTVTSLLEKILVRDGQMGKMHRTRYGERSVELSCPPSSSITPSQHIHPCVHQLKSSLNSIVWGFWWRFYGIGVID